MGAQDHYVNSQRFLNYHQTPYSKTLVTLPRQLFCTFSICILYSVTWFSKKSKASNGHSTILDKVMILLSPYLIPVTNLHKIIPIKHIKHILRMSIFD